MIRRTVITVLAVAALALGLAVPAQGFQATVLRAATTTPVVAAGSGVAVFVASGLPSGPASLQWFNRAKGSWVKVASVAKRGTRGSASFSGLPAGVNRFRINASGRTSTVMRVTAVATPTGKTLFNSPGTMTLFNSTMFPLQTVSGVQAAYNIAPVHQCEYVNLGMGPVSGNFSGWYLEATILSETFGPRVIRTDVPGGVLQKDIPIKGVTTITFAQNNTSTNQFGLQAYCLTSPF